jgi:hypothetical protein
MFPIVHPFRQLSPYLIVATVWVARASVVVRLNFKLSRQDSIVPLCSFMKETLSLSIYLCAFLWRKTRTWVRFGFGLYESAVKFSTGKYNELATQARG